MGFNENLIEFLAATVAAAKHHHRVDWTAITALAAVFSSFAAILVAIFNPWLGSVKARLELLSEKLERLYGQLKEERRINYELMTHYLSFVPPKKDDTQDLKKPAEDFRRFQERNPDIEVLINLFFHGFPPFRRIWFRIDRPYRG